MEDFALFKVQKVTDNLINGICTFSVYLKTKIGKLNFNEKCRLILQYIKDKKLYFLWDENKISRIMRSKEF